MKKLFNIVYWLILAVVVLIAATVVLSTFDTPLKLRLFAVQSGSMEPAIPLGSVVVVRPQEDYQKDDVVTVRSERSAKETVTHRIIEVVEGESGKKYQLKGDANEDPDRELVSQNRVIGKVVFDLPYLGYAVGFAQTQVGFIALIVVPATIIIYSEGVSIKKELEKMFKGKKDKNNEKED